ncbi:MAG: GNAT family N-acetyltransferase, partial [Rikenella sp.]|nr:GNAT family N-acetyltransferase [Rikenella sp.]
DGRIVAFLGTADAGIEMLFVAPAERGRGIGRELVLHAVRTLGCRRVEVNEQNEQAVGFYLRMGFRQTGRTAVDGEGLPYPILRLEWSEGATGRSAAPRACGVRGIISKLAASKSLLFGWTLSRFSCSPSDSVSTRSPCRFRAAWLVAPVTGDGCSASPPYWGDVRG